MKNTSDLLKHKAQYQLRGMAVLEDYQGLGLGRDILSHGERLLKSQGVELVWCNARKIAVNFYKRQGYKIIGEPFNIPEIGMHFIMHKFL